MAESTDTLLLRLAAEGVAPVVAGCTDFLAAGALRAPARGPGAAPPLKGIAYFGPPIVERWLKELGSWDPGAQLGALVALAGLTPERSRGEAAALVDGLAAGASPEDRRLAVEYLTAVPLAVRRSLIPDPATGRPTLYPGLSTQADQGLLRVLPADVPPFAVGTILPGTSYELEELLGIGGFGAVYRARNRFEQNQPPRAIKFCLEPALAATLHREQAILDRLMVAGDTNWSNRIVRLYGYALDVQPPFLVYEHVPGGDLTTHLTAVRQRTGRGFAPALALEVVRQVAEALALAHDQGLVHRDLKPANLLVSGTTIKVTDFGIGAAVATHWSHGLAGSGAMTTQALATDPAGLFRGSGTPLYMSAEQRRGDAPDPRHDLYSLGVVWYQLLVGDVTRELHPGWPDELTEEFQTPREHIELIQRCVGYFKKRPANAGGLLALLPRAAAATATAAGPAPAADEVERLRGVLADQIDRDALREAHRTVTALLRLRPEDPEAREVKTYLESRLAAAGGGREAACFAGHQGWVRGVAVTPDGRLALSGGDDRTVRVWDLRQHGEVCRLDGHAAAVMAVAVAPDGRRVVSAGWDGTLRVWELATGRLLRRIEGGWKAVKTVAVTPDGRRVVFGADDRLLHVWELDGGEVHRLAGHTDLVQTVAVGADGRRALSGGDDNSVWLWDLEAGRELGRLDGHTDSVTGVALAPNGKWAVSGSSDGTLRLWNLEAGRCLRQLFGHASWVNAVAVAPDGHRILSGSGGEIRDGQFHDGRETTVRAWDMVTGRELACYEGHTASVTAVAFTPDGRFALSGSLDRTVRLWERPA